MKFGIAMLALLISVTATAQEYKRLHRTYLDLSQMNLDACKKSFRFLNGNYMDCQVDLPQSDVGVPLAKITPGQYMPKNVTLTTDTPDYLAYVDMRDSAYDYIDASLSTHLILSMYYQLPDKPGYLQTLPVENYGWPVFEKFLRQALTKISQEQAWKTNSAMIALPWSSSTVQEHIIGSIYVAMNTIPVDVGACQRSLTTELVDAWPDDDYWITKCSSSWSPLGHGEPLPLNAKYWAQSLQAADPRTTVNKGMIFNYSAWGWNMVINGKYEWSEIADQVHETFAMVGPKVNGYYIVDEASLYQYGGAEWTMGKLIQKNGKMDIEPNPPQ
ncbi:MAG: hypothetical protein KF799_09455 [Bdellovibrionales bacterium]|nr:hypothetical protein [Bdellovibrionales bacterium]